MDWSQRKGKEKQACISHWQVTMRVGEGAQEGRRAPKNFTSPISEKGAEGAGRRASGKP